MGTHIDLTGKPPFGRLTVLYRDIEASTQRRGSRGRLLVYYVCECLCGNHVSVQAAHLRSGHTTSCGCVHEEGLRQRSTKHGATSRTYRMPEYRIWCHMLGRCANPRDHKYPSYGARGITVDASWLHDFPQFLADMGSRPSPQHSIERRNNDGPYSKDNCYWATPAQQSRNTRQNVFLTWNNETHCLIDWAAIIGINEMTLRYRLRHWPYDKVFTTPNQRRPTYT